MECGRWLYHCLNLRINGILKKHLYSEGIANPLCQEIFSELYFCIPNRFIC